MAVPVIMPKLEMSQETATVVEWLKGEGEQVRKGEPLLSVETDKVTVDVESPASGVLAGVRVGPQQVVPVTETIAHILRPGENLPKEARLSQNASASASLRKAVEGAATPVARRLAVAHGVDLGSVAGTGAQGRITKTDVEFVVASRSGLATEISPDRVRATPAARRIAQARGVDLAAITGSGPRGRVQAADVTAVTKAAPTVSIEAGDVVRLSGKRRTIAERLTLSYQTAPHITLTVRVDMTGFEAVRRDLNAKADAAAEAHVSLTALVVKAVAWALDHHPWLNSTLRGDEIHLLRDINIGVAVAVDDGLIVPVVRRADEKGVAEIAAEVNELAVRAREGRLVPQDVAGGTFTITNLGMLGIEQFTAIINPPQAAILALGAVQPEALVGEGGQIEARPVMRMTLSADHRVVDGAVAARFVGKLREALETPMLLLW